MDIKYLFGRGAEQVRRVAENVLPKRFNPIALNLKFYGYELARSLAATLPIREQREAQKVGLACKPSTQADLESDWAAHWCAELKIPVIFHRKVWELVYVLQALHDADLIREGARGLGFGCGREPIASYLASRGIRSTITDLPTGDARRAQWSRNNQHTTERDHAYFNHLVPYSVFDELVEFQPVDMNFIPEHLEGYDFCWSICAFEHLGSIERGLIFVERAMRVLKPGGLAIHTTEFNFLDDKRTLSYGATVLFQRQHFETLAERLVGAGHSVAPLDFNVGSKPLDRFIDMPPYPLSYTEEMKRQFGEEAFHLKLMIGNRPCTCFGLIVTRGSL